MAFPIPVVALTQQQLLDIFDRILPQDYLAPLKDPGPGFEVLQAYAKLFARISQAVEDLGRDAQIATAQSGSKATGEVELFRAAPHSTGLTIIVSAGTQVTTSKGGRAFITIIDVEFGPLDLGPFTVPIEAVSLGYEWNREGQVIAADGTVLEGEIDTITKLVEEPQLGDLTIQVRQIAPTTGGVDAALDALGEDRGIVRNDGEFDAAYQARVRQLPDTISPLAIERTVAALMDPINSGFLFLETFDPAYQSCWDSPSAPIAGSNFDPNLFVWDDPDPDNIPFRNRWLDENEHRGAFIVVVENVQPLTDLGMVYDDTAANSAAFVSNVTGGARAATAFDVPPDLGFGYLQGAYDGIDLAKQALYKGIFDTLQEIKAAGVAAIVELRGE